MTLTHFILTISASALILPFAYAGSDYLGDKNMTIRGPDSEEILHQTTLNLKSVFQNYVPVVDSGSTITSPLRVEGTATNPQIRLSVKKCIFGFCKTVDLNAVISLAEAAHAKCDRF